MTKGTIKIDLPPPQAYRKRGASPSRWVWIVLIAMALMGGTWLGWKAGKTHTSQAGAEVVASVSETEEASKRQKEATLQGGESIPQGAKNADINQTAPSESETVENPAERSAQSSKSASQTARVAEAIASAREAVAAGHWGEALRLFEEVRILDPENPDALASLPLIQRRLEELRGIVRVDTIPPGASVSLGSFRAQKSPAIFTDVPFGGHELTVTMTGFEPIERKVQVESVEPLVLSDIEMIRCSGQIEVVSEPRGADFKLVRTREKEPEELVEVGRTPAKIERLDPGEYQVYMSVAGFPEQSQSVRVENNRNASVSAVFARGGLNLTSDPVGAEVWIAAGIDKKVKPKKAGVTPLSLSNLAAGKHQIELRHGEWEPIRRVVDVVAGETQDLEFEWTRSLVSFESDPPGAEIYLGDRRLGRSQVTTPFQWELPDGEYRFRALHPLLGELSRTVETVGNSGEKGEKDSTGSGGTGNRVVFSFSYGSVTLESDPPGAAIVSDGKPLGRTPLVLSVVSPGEHQYHLSKEGFRSTSVGGQVEAGASLRFDAALTYDPTPVLSKNFVNGLGRTMVWVPDLNGWAGAHEVTQAEYEQLGGSNPSYFKAPDHPVDSVTWFEAVRFCDGLNAHEKSLGVLPAGYHYRLPTDEEWSHLVSEQKLDGAVSSLFERQKSTQPVGSLAPNKLGLFDVRGNVWEWVSDWYSQMIVKRIESEGATPTREWVGTDRKVLRGGAWNRSGQFDLEVGTRMAAAPASKDRYDVGFRVVLMREP